MITVEELIEEEIRTSISVPSRPGLTISREANIQPPGEYVDGAQRAVRALLRQLRADGIPDGARIHLSRVSEGGITFALPDGQGGYGGYHQARINPARGEVTGIAACGLTPADEL